MSNMKPLKNMLPLKIFAPILAIALLSLVSFAASVNISTSSSEAVQGVSYNVAGGFTAASNGVLVTQSAATASSQPATWSNGGTVTTATVVGNWQYSVTVTITASATASTTYTFSVQWNTGSGYSSMGSLTFTTPATITAGQTMNFVLNTAVTTFNAPAGLVITIA
jgi:hypothetical protein